MNNSPSIATVPGVHWLAWTTGIHIALVALLYYMVIYAGFHSSSLLHEVNLAGENNLSVWWSGFCLMAAGLLFYSLGSQPDTQIPDRIMWFSLSLVTLALSLDETGSLHERIHLLGGWWALLPFGLVSGAVFVFAIIRCLMQPEYRRSGLLILTSLAIFVGVAGMEHLNSASSYRAGFLFERRLIVEEGMELVAISLLLLAAVSALSRRFRCKFRKISIVVDPANLAAIFELLYAGLVIHLCIAIFWTPYLWNPARGNPIYWFPMLVFTLAAFHCMHRFSRGEGAAWLVGSVLLLLLSSGQIQDLGVIAGKIPGLDALESDKNLFTREAWTVLPLLPLLLWKVPIVKLAPKLLLLAGVSLMLRNGSDQFESYFIFSGVFSLMVFNLLFTSEEANPRSAAMKLSGSISGTILGQG